MSDPKQTLVGMASLVDVTIRDRDRLDADAFRKLQRILGYVENSSEQIVTLSHDDATRTVHLTVKGYLRDSKERNYHGTSLIGAIQAAIDAGEGEE